MWPWEVVRTGTSKKPVLGKAVSPSIAAEPQCLRPFLGLSEEHKSKKKKQKKQLTKEFKENTKWKTKSRHMWICRRLFGHYGPGTATGPNVQLACHDACREPLHTLAAPEVILASVTCSASWLTRTHLPQDSPLHSLTQDDTNSDAVICWCYLIVAKNCLQTSPRKWIGELRIHYMVFIWSGSF